MPALIGLGTPPPERSDGISAYVLALLDQSRREGCVGWSLAQALWTRWSSLAALAGRPVPVLPSPLFIWNVARMRTGNADQNDGTYIRDAIKQLVTLGVPPDSAFPADDPDADFMKRPDMAVAQQSFDQRFPLGYYRIADDPVNRKLQIKQAIAAGYVVEFGTLVENSFLNLGKHSAIPRPTTLDNIAGGHALPVMAYDENGVIGPNSWQNKDEGLLWGNDGWFYMSWDYMLWDETNDLWAIDPGLPSESWPVSA